MSSSITSINPSKSAKVACSQHLIKIKPKTSGKAVRAHQAGDQVCRSVSKQETGSSVRRYTRSPDESYCGYIIHSALISTGRWRSAGEDSRDAKRSRSYLPPSLLFLAKGYPASSRAKIANLFTLCLPLPGSSYRDHRLDTAATPSIIAYVRHIFCSTVNLRII